MAKFRKKPVIVEAIRWDGGNNKAVADFCVEKYAFIEDKLLIGTFGQRAMEANMGDWIIRGVKGELYSVKSDIFAATYEKVEDAAQG